MHVRDRGSAPAGKLAVICKAKGKDLVYRTLQTAKKSKDKITCPRCYKGASGEDMLPLKEKTTPGASGKQKATAAK